MKVKYLEVKDVLLLHSLAIENAGGSEGLRDLGLLESAVFRPQASYGGEDLYPTIIVKAASLLHSLLRNHAFVDGNKRTSMYAAMTFLELNGYIFVAEQMEVVEFAVAIENKKLSIEEIADWLTSHTKKVKSA